MAVSVPKKVIIIGGGIAGPILALSLKQHNISSVVFELREHGAHDGGFIALAPNALRVLDRVGLCDRISNQGWNFEELRFLSARNLSHIGTVYNGNQAKYGYKAVRVARGVVRRTLLDMLQEQGIEVRYGVKCIDVHENEKTSVTATFSDGHSEEADLVIGADGSHSQVRKYIDRSCVPHFSGQMGLGGPVPRSKLSAVSRDMYLPCMILGKSNGFALMPSTKNGDEVGCFATMEAKDRSREEWSKLGADKHHLSNILQDRHSTSEWPKVVQIACQEVDIENLSLWPFYKLPTLKSWYSTSGRIILIGDSAHAIPPTGGQGAAMALEDAATLADTLTRPKDNLTMLGSISHWQEIRQQRIDKVIAFTSKGGDMRKASVSVSRQIVKEWAMRIYFWYMGKDMGMQWLYEYDTKTFGY